jgi:hypothetical protein
MNQLVPFPRTLTGVEMPPNSPAELARKAEIFGLLEQIGETLDLTDTQYGHAQARSEAVGEWLAGSPDPMLTDMAVYVQGSIALGTAVKPIASDEYDADLVARTQGLMVTTSPAALKAAIGERLRENGRYAPILEEKQRCWRLTFAGDLHLDITPAILNPRCDNGGELVPDKKLSRWKPTNPIGYRELFERRAALKPRVRMAKAATDGARADAQVVAFPAQTGRKGVLRRTVQLLKRNRDVFFQVFDKRLAPLSVIITTLAAQSYEYCVKTFEFDNAYDLLRATVSFMPVFIDVEVKRGERRWHVWNETTDGEDFAEKWNEEPDRAAAFFQWHTQLLRDIDRLVEVDGLDQLKKSLSTTLGSQPVAKAFADMAATVSTARTTGALKVAPAVGLTTAAAAGTPVRANTFFGA